MQYTAKKNFIYSSIARFTNFLMLVLLIIAARRLGREDYGELSAIMALVYVFENLSDLGLSEITLRDTSENLKNGPLYLGNLLVWKMILSFGVMGVLASWCHIQGFKEEVFAGAMLFACSSMIKSCKTNVLAVFKAYNQYGLEAASVTGERLALLGGGSIVLWFWPGIINLMLVFVGVRLVDWIVTFFLLNRWVVRAPLQFNWPFIWHIQRRAAPLGFHIYIAYMYSYADTLILWKFKNEVDVGLYNAAYKLYDGSLIVGFAFYYALLPLLSRSFMENKNKHIWMTGKSIKYTLLTTSLIAVLPYLFAPWIIKGLYGVIFIDSSSVLRVLMVGFAFSCMNIVFKCIFISINRLYAVMWLSFIGLAFNILINFILIPFYSYIGAALSTVLSEMLVFGLCIAYLQGTCIKSWKELEIVKPLTLTLITIAVLIIGVNNNPLLLFCMAGGIFVFYRLVCIEEYKELRLLFKGGKI